MKIVLNVPAVAWTPSGHFDLKIVLVVFTILDYN